MQRALRTLWISLKTLQRLIIFFTAKADTNRLSNCQFWTIKFIHWPRLCLLVCIGPIKLVCIGAVHLICAGAVKLKSICCFRLFDATLFLLHGILRAKKIDVFRKGFWVYELGFLAQELELSCTLVYFMDTFILFNCSSETTWISVKLGLHLFDGRWWVVRGCSKAEQLRFSLLFNSQHIILLTVFWAVIQRMTTDVTVSVRLLTAFLVT